MKRRPSNYAKFPSIRVPVGRGRWRDARRALESVATFARRSEDFRGNLPGVFEEQCWDLVEILRPATCSVPAIDGRLQRNRYDGPQRFDR